MKQFCIRLCLFLAICAGTCVFGNDAVPKPLFRDFMGLNGHTVLFRPKLYAPIASQARDYHPAEWDLGKDSASIPPFPFARNGVDWNQVYGSWKREGWRVDASVMFETLSRTNWKSLAADSRAYGERLARALGPSSTNALLESVEIGNEPGKFSDPDYRTVFENMARGLKAGDSRLRVVTCAMVTGKSHDYAKSVDCITGLESLYDVLNVHSYAQLENWPTWRRSFPEDPRLKDYLQDVKKLCDWRDRHAPGKEVWLTEFGYDSSTRKPDPKSEFKDWVGVTDEQQAQWIVRSWLIFSDMPIQRAYLYFFNDDDQPQMHGAAGLTRKFEPKPSFYAAAHLKRVLGDYRFSRVVLERAGEARIYEFIPGDDSKAPIWVAWSPTGNGRTATLELPKSNFQIQRIEQMPLQPGEPPVMALPTENREVTIGESPIYILMRR